MEKKADDNVIDMEEDSSGTFKAVVIRKKLKPQMPYAPMMEFNMRRQSTMAQLLDGFVIGLDIVDRLLEGIERVQRKKGGG